MIFVMLFPWSCRYHGSWTNGAMGLFRWPFRSQQGLVKKPGSGTIDILRVTWGWMDPFVGCVHGGWATSLLGKASQKRMSNQCMAY